MREDDLRLFVVALDYIKPGVRCFELVVEISGTAQSADQNKELRISISMCWMVFKIVVNKPWESCQLSLLL